MNVISTVTGKQLIQQVKRFCHLEKWIANIEQPNIINQYNMSTEGDYCMDQNISAYMINLQTKKWCWPVFWFVVDVAVSNAYQIHCQSHLYTGEYRLDALGFHQAIADAYYHLYRKSLLSTTLSTGSHSLPLCKQFAGWQYQSLDCQGLTATVWLTRMWRSLGILLQKMQCWSSCWLFWNISL